LYLLAALAVAGPVLFHLWRRTPRGRRSFSTLMFLSPSPPRITSRSRIEHWLLLLLRGAALILLALAFSRPLWRTAIQTPEPVTEDEIVAVLVDTSASLQRKGLWDALQRTLEDHLAQIPESASVGVYQFHDRWSAVADFAELKPLAPRARRELIRTRIRELRPGWGATHLGDALIRTASALQEVQTDRTTPVRLRILLATDLPQGARLEPLNGYEWPKDLRLEVLSIPADGPTNAGMQWIERNPDLPDDVLRVRVTNASNSRREQFQIAWKGAEQEALPVYVPPGQSRVVIPPKRPESEQATALVLIGDDQDFDNTLYIAPRRDEVRQVVYIGADAANDPASLRFYLDGVFSASQRYRIETEPWNDGMMILPVAKPALVVVGDAPPAAEAFLKSYKKANGTVLIACPSAASLESALRMCGVDAVTVTEAEVKPDAMIGDIDFEHPVFAPFAESQFSDFTGIRFWKHRTMSGFRPDILPGATPAGGRVLARFDDGDPALVEFRSEGSRLWVLTAGWHPADSQLARSSKFPPLLLRMLEVASGEATRVPQVAVGGSIAWPASADRAATGSVRGPDGTVTKDLDTAQPFSATGIPGLYEVTRGDRTEAVAVNLAPDECRTGPLPLEQLESLGVRLGDVETTESARRNEARKRQLQIEELEQSQKLWRWALLVTLAILVMETWLAGRYRLAPTES